MNAFRDSNRSLTDHETATLALGTVGGLTLGVLVSRALSRSNGQASNLRARTRETVNRLRPARLRRRRAEQAALDQLEEAILRSFLNDVILCERGIDIGAISPGIVELSGSVWALSEAERAVDLANRCADVQTVVNRLEIERLGGPRRESADLDSTFGHRASRTGGMGRRRQGFETDPRRPDDSQPRREDALAAADREQWADEGFAPGSSRMDTRPGGQSSQRTHFAENQLDNQDPHRQHARETLDTPPEALNSSARVGETPKPGVRRGLEGAGLQAEERRRRDEND